MNTMSKKWSDNLFYNSFYMSATDVGVCNLFASKGWLKVDKPADADLIVFPGGSDVDPELYGHKNVGSYIDKIRDRRDIATWNMGRVYATPMVGICRGGQFLNIKSGGTMYQDVDGHLGNHKIITDDGEEYEVTSTHHQMMKPAKDAKIIAVSTQKNSFVKDQDGVHKGIYGYEVLFYEHTNSLCFQPHPEYNSCPEKTTDWFFSLLVKYFGDHMV